MKISLTKLFRRDKHKVADAHDFSDDFHDRRYAGFHSPTEPDLVASARLGVPGVPGIPGIPGDALSQTRSRSRSRSHGHRTFKSLGSGNNQSSSHTNHGHGKTGFPLYQRRRSSSASAFASSVGLRPSPSPPHGAPAHALLLLPDAVLGRIFGYVCPHALDHTYEKCEESSFDNACMLCDMRDLAHCAQVCRRWRPAAETLLYSSIRIDAVHYCEREALLSDRRKRRSFFDRNAEPEDTADARLKLLCRTLRGDVSGRLGSHLQFLKIPYMLRESKHADIARTVSVLPNLRYVDLPEGLFMDDPVYLTLKVEIQARCPDLRKMTYMAGAERSLHALATGTVWSNLEVLDLVRIGMDPATFRHILSALPNLRALKVTESAAGPHAFSDDVLSSASASAFSHDALDANGFHTVQHASPFSALPDIPALEELVLTDTARITAAGLLDYLARPDACAALKVLTLTGTGVKPWHLQDIFSRATALRHLTIIDKVSAALPTAAGTKNIPPLSSTSLSTLNYEIKADDNVGPYADVTRSYYNYLSGSILSGGLPHLRAVYVCDAQFPESLLMGCALPPPPCGLFGGGGGGAAAGSPGTNRPSSSGSLVSSPRASVMSGMSGDSLSNLALLPHAPASMLSPPHTPGRRQPSGGTMPMPIAQAPVQAHRQSNPFMSPQSPFRPKDSDAFPSSPSSSIYPSTPPPKPWVQGHGNNNNSLGNIGGNGNNSSNPRFSSNNPFAGLISPQQMRTLEVFTKGDDDLDWSSIVVDGGGGDVFGMGGSKQSSSERPTSSYGLGAELGAGAGARKSVLVTTGGGNFLAVPPPALEGSRHSRMGSGQSADLWPRPMSSAGERRREQRDLWR